MLSHQEDFVLDCTVPGHAVLSGVLRLPSPAAYEERLAPAREALVAAGSKYTIDIKEVQFLNSSGITGLSRLVLLARREEVPLVFLGSSESVWQSKTLRLIARLYNKVEVRID